MSTSAMTHFSYRSVKELSIWSGYPDYKPITGFEKPETTTTTFGYSKYGHTYAYATSERVFVFDASSMKPLCQIDCPKVNHVWFSPQGTFIVTWDSAAKLSDGSPRDNLNVWDVQSGEVVASFKQKSPDTATLQWTDDESYCARVANGNVHFWKGADFKDQWAILKSEGESISQFSLSAGKDPMVAVFIPEKKDQPGKARIYSLTNLVKSSAEKTFFNAERADLHWNKLGTNLLVLTHTEVDKSGKSYFGSTHLYSLAIAGNIGQVSLDKTGPVHDVAWSPNSNEFMVIYGVMPAKATLFDKRSKRIHDFGERPWNYISFDPLGRTICIAGFGNLNGTIHLWEREPKTTPKLLKTFQSPNVSYCEWSPCGQYLMTATLTPRMRVDNGFKMFHRTGNPVYEEAVDELFQIRWRPEPIANFSNQLEAVSPRPIKLLPTKNAPVAPTGAWLPRHLRGNVIPTKSLSEREAQQSGLVSPDNRVPNGSRKGSPNGKGPNARNSPPLSDAEKQKKLRSLEKKLRQIDELKKKLQSGETLDDAQSKKLATETGVVREIESLK